MKDGLDRPFADSDDVEEGAATENGEGGEPKDKASQRESVPQRKEEAPHGREGGSQSQEKVGEAAAADQASVDDQASADKGKKSRSKRKRRTIFIVAFLLIAGIVGGVAYYLYSSQYITTDDAFVDGDIVRVAPQEAGVIVNVAVEDNAHVEKGDLLIKIDAKEAQATLALRQAQLDQAEAQVAQAQAQVEQAKAQVEQAESTQSGNQATAQNARNQANRYQNLFKQSGSGAISRQALDNAQATADQAESQAEASRTAVDNAKAGVTAAQATLKAARAAVEAQQASVSAAKVTLSRLTIRAPIDGQVVQKNVNIGSYVSPGTQMMAIVPEHLYVTANYKETQLDDIRIGAPADLSIDAFPEVDFKGTVQSIQHGAGQAFQLLPPQNATGNFVKVVQRVPVRISIDSPSPGDYPIGPGMSVVPSIHAPD